MTSIPLLCNICPKEPDFSDISHLLTHVASKGHLAQELKAKVRARQDVSIREKLNAYDRWYEKHQIERLLSQRLILKESKGVSTTTKARRSVNSPSAHSAKHVKPRRKRVKSSQIIPGPSPVESEEPPIDPQLWVFPPSSPSPFFSLPEHGGLQKHDQASNHRYHIPRMCEAQDPSVTRRAAMISTPSKVPSDQKTIQGPGPDTDSENDYFNTFIRSPTVTAYPDPSEIHGLPIGFSPPQTMAEVGRRPRTNSTPDSNAHSIDKAGSIQPPVLKGVKWPGMSIFDSASLQAQRLRNQKKDGSILEQMEHNSVVVEQTERIYWPDGSLKMERLITGNVESSPLKEPTPPPKRQRTKAKKTVLANLSTNAPKPVRRPHKSLGQFPGTQADDLRNTSRKALATLDPPPPQFSYPTSDDEFERRLTIGNTSNVRQQAFEVFNDNAATECAIPRIRPAKQNAKTEGYPFLHHTHGRQGPPPSQAARLSSAPLTFGNPKQAQPDGLLWDAQPRPIASKAKPSVAEEDGENIEPILDGDGRIDDQGSQAHIQRTTQRYFSVTGNQPPQFFNSLPPHMDFGGLAEAKYHGSTLNLLNPYLRQHHLPQSYSPLLFHHPNPSFLASRQDDIGKSGWPAVAKGEGSNETKRF